MKVKQDILAYQSIEEKYRTQVKVKPTQPNSKLAVKSEILEYLLNLWHSFELLKYRLPCYPYYEYDQYSHKDIF